MKIIQLGIIFLVTSLARCDEGAFIIPEEFLEDELPFTTSASNSIEVAASSSSLSSSTTTATNTTTTTSISVSTSAAENHDMPMSTHSITIFKAGSSTFTSTGNAGAICGAAVAIAFIVAGVFVFYIRHRSALRPDHLAPMTGTGLQHIMETAPGHLIGLMTATNPALDQMLKGKHTFPPPKDEIRERNSG